MTCTEPRAGGDPERYGAISRCFPGGESVEDGEFEPWQPAVVDGRLGKRLEFPGDIVGEPPNSSTWDGNGCSIDRVRPRRREIRSVEDPFERGERRRLLPGIDRFGRCAHREALDGVDTEVPPAGLATRRLEERATGSVTSAPIGRERIVDGESNLDRNPRSRGCGRYRLSDRLARCYHAWLGHTPAETAQFQSSCGIGRWCRRRYAPSSPAGSEKPRVTVAVSKNRLAVDDRHASLTVRMTPSRCRSGVPCPLVVEPLSVVRA